LFILFIISIVIYFFLTSWFTVYGCYLSGKHIDEQFIKSSYKTALRGLEFFGGLVVALFLLIAFAAISIVYATVSPSIPILLNVIYFIVGAIIIGFAIVCIRYFFKKILIGWTGIFFILVVFYTFYLVLKVFLGMGSSGSSSTLLTKIALLVFDFIILIYSMSLIIGSQAQILAERILSNNRYVGIDTIIIGLIFAKVSYEFAVNFPYDLLKTIPLLANVPLIELIIDVGSELSLIRNIMVLIFYLFLLILVGLYQIRKYVLIENSIKRRAELGDKVVKDEDLEEVIEAGKIVVHEMERQLIKKFESERENLEETDVNSKRDETEKFNEEEKRDEGSYRVNDEKNNPNNLNED